MNAVALREPETQARLPSVGTGFFDLQSFELMQRVARGFSASTLVPKIYQGSTPEAVGNCMIAVNLAKRMNADPLMVMQNLNIIQNRPSWSSPFLIATVNTCGKFTTMRFEFFGKPDTDSHGCRAIATEKATGEKLVGTDITIKLAKEEGWYGRNGSKWRTMGQQMLIYRSAAFWTRAYAPELSMGLLTADEVEDIIDLEPSSYRDVTPARGRSRPRAAAPANDITTIDAGKTPPADRIDDEPRLDPAQLAALLTLVAEAGADVAKVCEWAGVSAFSDIPASGFERVRKALEAKRQQMARSTDPSFAAEGNASSSAAGAPAQGMVAGAPASPDSDNGDAGDPPTDDPWAEAREAGRNACEGGVDFKDTPEKYRDHAYKRKAWQQGFQQQAQEMGA